MHDLIGAISMVVDKPPQLKALVRFAFEAIPAAWLIWREGRRRPADPHRRAEKPERPFLIRKNTSTARAIALDDLYDARDEDVVPSGVAGLSKLQQHGYPHKAVIGYLERGPAARYICRVPATGLWA